MVPMQTAFTDAFLALSAYANLEIFDYCIDCLFFIDILLNFNTGTGIISLSFISLTFLTSL